MNRQVIQFTTEESWLSNRVHDLTSSDVPCLFGVGYQTYEELLESKKNKCPAKVEWNERMQWGIALQDGIAYEFARRNNWDIVKKLEYIRIPELRLGSSFDYVIREEISNTKELNIKPGGIYPLPYYSEIALLEIKNISQETYRKFVKGFEIEATPYIEIQVQHQLLVSGLNEAYIGCLIAGCQGLVLHRKANKKIQDAILIKAEKFWREVDESK